MNTHELAEHLRTLAGELESRESLSLYSSDFRIADWVWSAERERLAEFAKKLRPSEKVIENDGGGSDMYRLIFGSSPVRLEMFCFRSKVCRLVEPAKPPVYECEPLLSPVEEAELISHE